MLCNQFIWNIPECLPLMNFKTIIWDKPNSKYNKAIEACIELQPFMHESELWMTQIFQKWFHLNLHAGQVRNAWHLCQGKDVFLTSKTGSGKSMLTMAPVIACRVLKRPHIAIIVYPTVELMLDQVSSAIHIQS